VCAEIILCLTTSVAMAPARSFVCRQSTSPLTDRQRFERGGIIQRSWTSCPTSRDGANPTRGPMSGKMPNTAGHAASVFSLPAQYPSGSSREHE
jgi:hypothetical protein